MIQQYLARYEIPFTWYQFGEEDRDPVYFVAALLAGLSRAIPQFAVPQLEHLLSAGQLSSGDLAHGMEVIRQQLATTLRADYCLVFDDLHLLEQGGEQTLALLRQFLAALPPGLVIMLATRRPAGIDLNSIVPAGAILHLRNEQMALTLSETRELYQSVFQLDVPGTFLQEIHAMTGGWIMGLVSLATSLAQAGRDADLKQHLGLPRVKAHYQDYFREEVFAQLPESMKESLLLLSLLDEIPVQLAEEVTGRALIAEELTGLQARNFFMRTLDDEGSVHGMHHLFAEYLRERAKQSLDRQRILDVYRTAARYYRQTQAFALSLDYWIRAEAWDEVESLLEREGVSFIARNQTRTLAMLLEMIPVAIRSASGWLWFFSAITDNEAAVIFSLEKLERAKNIFTEQAQRKGTLLALSQIIWLHMASTGLFQEGCALLAPADRLYTAIQGELSVDESVLVCRNIGAGALLFDLDVAMSGRYLDQGAQLAREHRLSGYLHQILIFQAFTLHFTGRIQACADAFEEIYPHLFSKQIGVIGRLSILVLLMNLLETLGEAELFELKKRHLPSQLSRQQVFSFILGPYLSLWELYLAVVDGTFVQAVQGFDAKRREIDTLNPHYQSQILGQFAYLFSLSGERERALGLLQQADGLRRLAGGRYHVTLHQLYAGATYAQCGLYDRALSELDGVIAVLRARGNPFLLASALMHRSWVALQVGNEATAEALHDLDEALALSIRNDIEPFRSVPPSVLEPLLLLAIRHDMQADRAHTLIRVLLNKGVLPQGGVIPLLELNVMGGISIRYQGRVVCRSEEIPYLQRELLALLVSMPDCKIGQEQVQGLLWPESDGEKARSNLDTLLSRLRSTLAAGVPKHALKHYVTLQKGMLCLRYCRIDMLTFHCEVAQGLRHLAAQRPWRAENSFQKAMTLWQGPFSPEVFGVADQVLFRRAELLDALVNMALAWVKIMRAMERTDEAIDLLRKAVSFMPSDDRLIRQLYYLLHGISFQQAMQLLAEYRQALIREEYPLDEVEAIIAQVAENRRRQKRA